jgi:Carotenoid biosynthesis protein
MFGYPMSVIVFTIAAFVAWGLAMWWAVEQPKYRWYHIWVLLLATLFWFISESIAIRLGKYHYPTFPLRAHLPWGGTPDHPGWLAHKLLSLLPAGEKLPSELNPLCAAKSWDIPLPVVTLEAALLFGLFRLSVCVLRSEKGSRLRAALATGGLSALLLVNATAVLDPVVSTNRWCEPVLPDPNYHYLTFGLWEWFATETHQGYWFGVPLVNYAGWFLAAGVFSFVARLDDERPDCLLRKYTSVGLYFLATIAITGIFFAFLIPLKIVVDRILVHGQDYLPYPIVSAKVWQFGVMLGLLGLGLLLFSWGQRHAHLRFHWIFPIPKIVIFAFCLGLLSIQPWIGIFVVWFVTASIATSVLVWPFIMKMINRRLGRMSSGKPTPGGDFSVTR